MNDAFAARLATWLDASDLPGRGEPIQITPLGGGTQNELLRVQRGAHSHVLRTPGADASPQRLRIFRREARLLAALRDTDVPHARLLACGLDGEEGLPPFYLTALSDGWCPTTLPAWPSPYDADPGARAQLAFQMIEGAAALARLDWRALGLEDFGHPEGFHERQVERWLAQLSQYRFRDLPGLEAVAAWLNGRRPPSFEPGLMHGDFHFGNVLFHNQAPARLAAIIDWELATVGDPLLDLGWLLVAWPPEGDAMVHTRYVDLTGMPSREALVERYSALTGRKVADLDYYVVLARFKLAIILERDVAERRRRSGGADGGRFEKAVPELIAHAQALADRA